MRSADALIGKVVGGRYEILSFLGKGGIGMVYRAKQRHLDRLCAIKVLFRDGSDDQESFARFEREAKVACALSSDNIVEVFDFGLDEDGFAYLVMELITGESLENLVSREGRISPSRAIPIFLCVTNALHFAHQNGAIHRDLKPANIMVSRDDQGQDQVKLVDFGLAKYFEENAGGKDAMLTTMGKILGTPSYMSPEQCMGRPLDARSDIYSLGCVIYRVLSGMLPFSAETTFEALTMHVSQPHVPLKEAAPNMVLSEALDRCVNKCLQKRPEDRYQNVMEMRADLEEALMACWTLVPASSVDGDTIDMSPDVQFDEKDADSLKTAASRGHSGAMYFLAMAQRNGDIVPKDEEQSMALLQKAAAAGFAQAQFELAACYDYGDYLDYDAELAVHWYRKAAENGVAAAMVNLGCILEGDRGVGTHHEEMLRWYKRAAESGNSIGQSNYGRCLYYGIGRQANFNEAFRWLQRAVSTDDNNDGAHYLLGCCYYNGDGVERDFEKAAQHYRLAANLNHASAECELGFCYLDGDGVEKDYEKAVRLFENAAQKGSQRAQEQLEVLKDSKLKDIEAVHVQNWVATAADVSSQPAEARLRSLLQERVDKPLREVISALKRFADKGHEFAIIILARCYEVGIGVPKDLAKAADLYLKAYDVGSDIVEPYLVACYKNCFESKMFPERAEGWLLLSAEQRGNRQAMIALATWYRSPNPHGRNFYEAVRWYRTAAESGDRDAQYLLARYLIMKNMNKRERDRLVKWWRDDVDPDLDPSSIDAFDEENFGTERAEALKWLHKAAEEGSGDALRMLSSLRNRMVLLDKDPKEAYRLLHRAAELDDAQSQGLLGAAILSGVFDDEKKKGIEWLERGNKSNDGFAQWNLALELIDGKNTTADRPRARDLLQSAAKAGFPQDRFWAENNFDDRFKRLIALFEDLARKGQKEARHWLGLCYEQGIGVEKDRDRSILLYLQASEQGYEPAKKAFEKAPDNLKNLARKRFLEQDFDKPKTT